MIPWDTILDVINLLIHMAKESVSIKSSDRTAKKNRNIACLCFVIRFSFQARLYKFHLSPTKHHPARDYFHETVLFNISIPNNFKSVKQKAALDKKVTNLLTRYL